jgi:protein-S-isoprenylcysteine O-methyltransferase Ste14
VSFLLKIVVFAVVSALLVWLSRGSVSNPRAHGFYRLFAWEAILILVLLNVDYWFDDWFGGRQIVSWILLAGSVYLVMHGAVTLYASGKPDRSRADSTLVGIEKTTELVTSGLYRYVRHPIYASMVVGVWGIALKHITAGSLILALISVIFLTITAKMEESENIRYFGEAYRDYMKKTRMFIPYVF